MNNQSEKRHLSIKETSNWTGLAVDTLYHMVSSKPPKIPHFKVGKRILFSIADLEQFMEANRRSA